MKLTMVIILLLAFVAPVSAESLAGDAEVEKFIQRMVKEHGFEEKSLTAILDQARVLPGVLKAMSRPAERLPWHRYKKIFLTKSRLDNGVKFWRDNAEILARAEKVTGVPQSIIVAIIGVETLYGKHKGKIRVIDSLLTLGFRYPKRSKFFLSELEQFLLLTREQKVDPLEPVGSYAGAMGMPQFISSSYRNYAIDFDNDGRSDLWNNRADVIGSVATYFKRHGWVPGGKVMVPARPGSKDFSALIEQGIKPQISLQQLADRGFSIEGFGAKDCPCALIELENVGSKEYWAAAKNFYVITRYNHSQLYAMAVYQLSRQIQEKHGS